MTPWKPPLNDPWHGLGPKEVGVGLTAKTGNGGSSPRAILDLQADTRRLPCRRLSFRSSRRADRAVGEAVRHVHDLVSAAPLGG